ncbi:MAG: phosphoribosylformylglycinamidine synthase subunit PurL [Firmicutes bacterium]|nr:phosphoribosylformylglycinamidine synthase subunit PurL [Bacillota bacterium]
MRWSKVGLTEEEYKLVETILGRSPNDLELALYGVMWSEHCSYKNSRLVLRRFPVTGPRVVQGPGENAGVIDIGDGLKVVFKMESHNHPSAIEPFQGAATGVGGILRDIFTMGARPIALLDSLRFGSLQSERTRHLLGGVVGGIAFYGNCIGVPTVGGEVYFEEAYQDNPLVNVFCLGILEKGQIIRGQATGIGNPVLLVGARTGRDGIQGASFASEELSEDSEERRPAVQVGDPFMEKLLLEATLELKETGLILGLQDLGAAGLTSAASEMAARAKNGLELDVLRVPRREEGMSPYEVMLSESQERMLLAVEAGKEAEAQKIFQKWGLEAAVIGQVTGDGFFRVKEGERVVAEVPVSSLADQAPVYRRASREPDYLKETRALDLTSLPEPTDYNDALRKLALSLNLVSREWIYQQYDYMVRTNTVLRPGADAAVLRLKGTKKGIAVSTDGNGRYVYLDPLIGGASAVAEAARNVVCTGAEPAAITNCLNFGNPMKPEVFWQFEKAVDGMSQACRALGTPVTGGNVSFYNETSGQSIYPTPVVGMVGVLEDIDQMVTPGFKHPGDVIVLLGETREELGGSEYLKVIHSRVAGPPPELNLEKEKDIQALCLKAIRAGLVASAHDVSEGGLATALLESCLAGNLGARVSLPGDLGGMGASMGSGRQEARPVEESPTPRLQEGQGLTSIRRDALLFGESQSRILLSLRPDRLPRLLEMARAGGVPIYRLGEVAEERLLQIRLMGENLIGLDLSELEPVWRIKLAVMLGDR